MNITACLFSKFQGLLVAVIVVAFIVIGVNVGMTVSIQQKGITHLNRSMNHSFID